MTILPQLERDLLDAAAKRLPAGDHPSPGRAGRAQARARLLWFQRRVRTALAPVPVLASVLVTVAVAAVALTVAGHRHTPTSPTAATGVQAARAQLVEHFAILRRSQTKADLDPTFLSGGMFTFETVPERGRRHIRQSPGVDRALVRWGLPKLDRSLVRVLPLPAWHAKLAFEPASFQPSPLSRQRSEGLSIELWIGSASTIPPSSDDGTGPRPTSVGSLLAHGLALTGGPRGRDVVDGVVVVPDGVARVTLGQFRLKGPPVTVDPRGFGTVSATVRDNVGAFQMPLLTVASRRMYSGLFGVGGIAQATWWDPAGKAIKHTTTEVDLFIKVMGKGPFPRPSRAALLRRRFCRQNPHAC